jgi:hypothetical protein
MDSIAKECSINTRKNMAWKANGNRRSFFSESIMPERINPKDFNKK